MTRPGDTILVTGGTGFVGSYIIAHLVKAGYRVRAIRRGNSTLPFYIPRDVLAQVQWFESDLFDLPGLTEAMNGADAVIHAAAKVSFHAKDKDDLFRTNVAGTANVVNVALEQNVRRLMHMSSIASLGRSAYGETITEERAWQPSSLHTNYALSKYQSEMEVWRAFGEGLNGVILNPSTVLGYGDWNTSSCAIFKSAYREFAFYTTGINGFVFVEDLARATVALMESDISNERFIVSGENWSFRQLFDTIAEGFGKRPPRYHATPRLAAIAWRVEKLRSVLFGAKPLLTRETARIAQTSSYFDHGKLLRALPSFSFTPLKEAVLESCRRYKQHITSDLPGKT